eukprot:2261872-Pleurochrysis_carterae.AAC.2
MLATKQWKRSERSVSRYVCESGKEALREASIPLSERTAVDACASVLRSSSGSVAISTTTPGNFSAMHLAIASSACSPAQREHCA